MARSLTDGVNPDDIVDSDEEVGSPNFMIDDTYGVTSGYGDYSLVERKVAHRMGKVEDGVNNGKVIRYIKWDVCPPFAYGSTVFEILRNYSKTVSLAKFKKMEKVTDFKQVEQIYKDIQTTIDKCLKDINLSQTTKDNCDALNEIAKMKHTIKQMYDLLENAKELHEEIKGKHRLSMKEGEPKKHRMKLEE